MSSALAGKNILLGVTGSIAAYKAADLLRRLQEQGAVVQVAMTKSAAQFVTADTLRTLSGMPVLSDLFAEPLHWKVEHVSLADWADLVLIAPVTANTMAAMAHGSCNDILTCLILSTRAPVLLAPAMDEGMWLHQATQDNAARLVELGYTVIEPAGGSLASGKVGKGRMAAVETIVEEAERQLADKDLEGRRIVVTAGPTHEPIDAVRYISNRSSGKMGFALAAAAALRGAIVTLVTGPTHLTAPGGVEVSPVETAQEMYQATLLAATRADVVIGAAAVGDFTPIEPASTKLKREGERTLALKPTPDIIAAVAGLGKNRPPVVVGFAAESENLIENAKQKIVRKGIDLIVANDVNQTGGVFDSDYNQASLIFADGRVQSLERLTKKALADEILEVVKVLLEKG